MMTSNKTVLVLFLALNTFGILFLVLQSAAALFLIIITAFVTFFYVLSASQAGRPQRVRPDLWRLGR